jgi:hypothetical protein
MVSDMVSDMVSESKSKWIVLNDVIKENIIFIDKDYKDDYPPEQSQLFLLSKKSAISKYQWIHRFRSVDMPLFFQRAKLVMDLAMPGAERVGYEAILFGAIPLISRRWNGDSDIDYPLPWKVDPLNVENTANEIVALVDQLFAGDDEMKDQVTDNTGSGSNGKEDDDVEVEENNKKKRKKTKGYERVLQSYQPFFAYVVSMSQRLRNTVDYFIGSSRFHFVIVATGTSHRSHANHSANHGSGVGSKANANFALQEELLLNYQILSLLYLFPLASIEVIVHDTLWYLRQHYPFFDQLRQSGYASIDPFDPQDMDFQAYNNVQSTSTMMDKNDSNASPTSNDPSPDEWHLSATKYIWKSLFYVRSMRKMDDVIKTLHEAQLEEEKQDKENQDDKMRELPKKEKTIYDVGAIPSWSPLYVYLPLGKVFTSPEVMFRTTHALDRESIEIVEFIGNGVVNESSSTTCTEEDDHQGICSRSVKDGDDFCKADIGFMASPDVGIRGFREHLVHTITTNHFSHAVSKSACKYGRMHFAYNETANAVVQNRLDEEDREMGNAKDLDWMDVCFLYCDSNQLGNNEYPIDQYLISGVKATPAWAMLRRSAEEQVDAGIACNCALYA